MLEGSMASVLVVDDDVMVRDVIRRGLERSGLEVIEAAEGAEALEKARQTAVDVLIVDVMMPRKGGIETLMELRRSQPRLKTIMVTGKVDTDSASFRNLTQAFGVSRVFSKPLDLEELARSVLELLAAP
jgi:CheY-like chemotaxis protein